MSSIIALDADGVLLDYHQTYARAWSKTFGAMPEIRDPSAYWPIDRYDVRQLEGADLARFRDAFDYDCWATIPAISGALDACHALVAAGHELVCVSAIESRFEVSRLRNLVEFGFPIERVVASVAVGSGESPKAAALRALRPAAFVDDFLPYLQGVPKEIHTALILREPNGSPNIGENLPWAMSQHVDLAAFAKWWLDQERR